MLCRIVNGMHLITSFTGSRGVRYPAPDVARGFMLLLIAVANVPVWNQVPDDIADTVQPSSADTWWVFIRELFVDHRAYPLFAMLFGFGLVTMINRRTDSGARAYLSSLPGVGAGRAPTPSEEAWAREQAAVDACRLVRRRGWWMILFGFVHGIVFPGDIIGAYGLVAVLFAGCLARKQYTLLYSAGAFITLLATANFLVMGFASQDVSLLSDSQAGQAAQALPWFAANIVEWTVALFIQVLLALIVPAAVLGARLADTDLVIGPHRHLDQLVLVGIGGLALGAMAAFHSALTNVLPVSQWPWDVAMKEVFGVVGACGWLALLALYAGGPTPDGRLTGLRWLTSAVGRRSMTAYLTQTILFGAIFVIVPLLVTEERLWVGQASAALIALGVWLTTMVLCVALEHGGHAGPFEALLRTAVARSERRRSTTPPAAQPISRPGA